MLHPVRYACLLLLAIASGVFAARAVSERDRVQDELTRAARENVARVEQIEADRLARLEAEADIVRAAADEARREATKDARWSTRPVAKAPPGDATAADGSREAPRAPLPPPAPVSIPPGVRAAARAIEGAIRPASKGSSKSAAAELTPRIQSETGSDAEKEEEKKEERSPGTGLRGEYWKLVDEQLHDFPDVEKRLPAIVRVDPLIDFPHAGAFRVPWITRNVAARWRGFLYAEEDGIYTFSLCSDDGMWLLIDGKPIIDNSGLHPATTKVADTYLFEGYHSIEARYFQNEGEANATLAWVPMRGEPGPVPTEFLYPAEQVRASQAPVISEIEPQRARSGQSVIIRGTGFPAPPEAVEATFDGIDMRAEAMGGGTIRATVPPGVDRGQVVVRVRDRTSLGVAYECGDVFGLLGEYIATPGGTPIGALLEMPPPGSGDAFRRVEPMIAFYSAGSFALPFAPRRFGARFSGSVFVQEPGEYHFKLTSDDGGRLWVGGEALVERDGLHGMTSGEGSAFLAQGFHDVLVEYFQNDGPAGLLLEWRPPGRPRYGVVPRRALYPPPMTARNDPPVIHELDPSPTSIGESLKIHGANFVGDARLDRVLLNGSALEIERAAPTLLVVKVPSDARSGDVVVQSGELVSKPMALKIVGRGLLGAYYRSEEDITTMPEFTTLTPVFERLDQVFHFGEAFSFDLPFHPEKFAIEWRGSIEAPTSGLYRFKVLSDDGSRLLIGGRRVVDNDGVHGFAGVDGEIELAAGRHPITLQYFQNYGHVGFDFWWARPDTAHERVPETVLFPER